MRFDTVTTFPCNIFSACGDIANGGSNNPLCSDPNYRATHPECGDDARCSDPVFAAANPTLCLNSPRLIIKPSAAWVEVLQDVQYVAFLVVNGVETELTDGVVWSIQDITIALIGAGSGNTTGIAVGITSVYATYGALTAAAQLEVIADGACATRVNHFVLLFDSSKSMGSPFGGAYNTRLDMAKEVAENLIVTANLGRDEYAVMKFDSSAVEVLPFSQDEDALTNAVMGVATSQQWTNLGEGLERAYKYFDEENIEADGRVIVLFTDGENNTGDDPIPVAQVIRESGIILIVIGLRAKYNPYRVLERMASGGFFVNALPSNSASVPEWISGLRSYLCSGNCVPEGCTTIGVGQLNFTAFTKWDVTAGTVDLIGKNDGGTPWFDLVPGNGLYVDMCGSGGGVPSDKGTIRTKDPINLTTIVEHRITVTIAGNQRQNRTPDVVLVEVIDPDAGNAVLGAWEFSITNYAQGFTAYTFTFSTEAPTTRVKIQISQSAIPATGETSFGSLLGSVILTRVSSGLVLFTDNFDAENPTFINPDCGYCVNPSTGNYGYGYDGCYNTCLEGAIDGQIPDPNPLPNLEGEAEPTLYSSTQSATACCANNLTNCATRVATAESDISQADADLRAYAAAYALAEAALAC